MLYVYFAKSLSNNKIYVGYTDNEPKIRVKEHNQKSNKWTKGNGPFKLIYYESYSCKTDAIKRENFYKSGIGKRIKKAIISEMDP